MGRDTDYFNLFLIPIKYALYKLPLATTNYYQEWRKNNWVFKADSFFPDSAQYCDWESPVLKTKCRIQF